MGRKSFNPNLIAGKQTSATVRNPGAPEDGKAIAWVNGTKKYDLVAVGGGSSITSVVVDTTAAPIVFDFATLIYRIFVGSVAIGVNKTIQFNNAANALKFEASIVLSAAVVITFPATVIMTNNLWDKVAKTWSAIDAGKYNLSGFWDGTNWNITITGPSNP